MSALGIAALVAVALMFAIPVLVFLIPIIAIIGGCAVGAVSEWRKGVGRAARREAEKETKLVQELHARLARMQERIEALETILIEREREETRL